LQQAASGAADQRKHLRSSRKLRIAAVAGVCLMHDASWTEHKLLLLRSCSQIVGRKLLLLLLLLPLLCDMLAYCLPDELLKLCSTCGCQAGSSGMGRRCCCQGTFVIRCCALIGLAASAQVLKPLVCGATAVPCEGGSCCCCLWSWG
jgi:hypothetical protein